MSEARERFVERWGAQERALELEVLAHGALVRSPESETARILRAGLMVQAYSSYEKFLKERTREAMARIGAGLLAFSSLPPGLQTMATFGAIEGLQGWLRYADKSDPSVLVRLQEDALAIGSTSSTRFAFPASMFGFSKSNLSPSDASDLLTAVGVGGDPFFHMQRVSARAGLGGLPVKDGLRAGYQRRNRAAHDPDTDLSIQEVADFLKASFVAALGFDALLSRAVQRIYDGAVPGASNEPPVLENGVTIRFVDRHVSGWREVREGADRAVAIHESEKLDRAAVVIRARPAGELIVIRDRSQSPIDWIATACP